MNPDFTRRTLLFALITGAMALALVPAASAKDGADDGGGGSSSGSSGSSGSGSDDSDDDDDDDDNSDDDHDVGSEARLAREAVSHGDAVSLRRLMKHLKTNYPGRVLDVDLKRIGSAFQYRVKILQTNGKVTRLHLDAVTLRRR